VVIDQACRCDGNLPFFVPGSLLRSPSLELPNRDAGAREEDPAVSPLGFARLFQRLQIPPDRRFTHIHRIPKIRDRYEAMLANQIAQLGPSSQRSVEMIGGNHPLPDGFSPKSASKRSKMRWKATLLALNSPRNE
jgi:hypothetical protein